MPTVIPVAEVMNGKNEVFFFFLSFSGSSFIF